MPTVLLETFEPRRMLSGYSLHTLASFSRSGPNLPQYTVVRDSAGDTFGIVQAVGSNGSGGIFEVPAGSSTPVLLAPFQTASSVPNPSGLVIDSAGNLFGTLATGGDTNNDGYVFELAKGGSSIDTVAEFNSATTGGFPVRVITSDTNGDIFGATESGGANNAGTVWEFNHSNQSLTALASFPAETGSHSDDQPNDVTLDSNGNLYGSIDGDVQSGSYGSIWELPSGSTTITTIATFNQSNGAVPVGPLVIGSGGSVFGATEYGGAYTNGDIPAGFGTVFDIGVDSGTVSTIASFNGTDGEHPVGGLVADSAGDLIGVASEGGITSATDTDGAGNVFELVKGTTTIIPLVKFSGTNGSTPEGPLTLDSSGNIFGTTYNGGASNWGSLFELTAGGSQTGQASLSATLTAVTPTTGVSGQRIKNSFTVTATNSGTALLNEAVSTQLFLSADGTIDANAISITPAVTKKLNLKGAAHTKFSVKLVTIPATVPAGTYQWIEQLTEPDGNIVDAVATPQIDIALPEVNLTGSFAKFATTAKAGKKFNETITVSNLAGNVTASGALPIVVETSPDDNAADATPLMTISKKIKIAVGKSSKISVALLDPTAGSYFLFIELDPLKTLQYDSSTNNIFASPAAVTVGSAGHS